MSAIESDPGFYERMAQRSKADKKAAEQAAEDARRAAVAPLIACAVERSRDDLVEWAEMVVEFANRRELAPEDREAIFGAPLLVPGAKLDRQMVWYDPSRYAWSAAQALTASSYGGCSGCFTAVPPEDGRRHLGWSVRMTCQFGACDHAHHDNDIWLAAS